MKTTGFLLAIGLVLSVGMYPAAAQNLVAHPLEGTWKLDAALSRFAPNHATAPKEETMSIRMVGDRLELTTSGTQKTGARIAGKYSFPKNGGEFKDIQTAPVPGEISIETVLEPGDRFLTSLKDGKQVEVQHLVISKDGKSMKITDRGTDAKGRPYESVSVYKKQ